MRLILASASPRRAELLSAAGFAFDVRPADVDESVRQGEAAGIYVRRLAVEKARAAALSAPAMPVLAADTIVLAGGEILGKPADGEDAGRMLRRLSGACHEVMTGVCLWVPDSTNTARLPPPPLGFDVPDTTNTVRLPPAPPRGFGAPDTTFVRAAVTTVEFAPLTDMEIDWYVATGEPMDKAGAYAVQGFASRFVTRIEGSYSNVVGLPVALVYEMCREAGLLLS